MSNKASRPMDNAIDFDELLSDPKIAEAVADAELREDLIDALIALRKKANLRQSDVAEYMECTQSTVSNFENESTDPYLSTLQRYARATGHKLNITIEDAREASFDPYSNTSVTISAASTWEDTIARSLSVSFAESYMAHESKRSDFTMAA